jgi:sugar lactone lactonase YvrE
VLPSAGGTPRIVTDPAFESMSPVWSRDGRWIYFASLRGGKRQVFRSASAGGKAVQVAGEDREETRDSVADATLHYGDPDSAESGAWHHPTDGKPDELVTALRTAHESRYWTLTRSGLYFLDGTEPPWTIRFLSFSTRATTPVIRMARPPAFGSFGLSVSPDGKWLLYTQVDQRSSDIVSLSVPQ